MKMSAFSFNISSISHPPAASLLAGMDATKDPCEDFFQYACGTWNKKHVIPEDRSSISTFEVSKEICVKEKVLRHGNQSKLINAEAPKNL